MTNVKYLLILLLLGSFGCKKSMYDEAEYRKKINNALVKKVTYLALGDSYTKGQSVPLAESFPYLLRDRLNTEPFIQVVQTNVIAQTGWTTTNLLDAIAQVPTQQYDLVTLLIGVNNQYQGKSITEYSEEFVRCLQKAIEFAGSDTSRVVVLSIPDYGYTPFGASNKAYISAQIDAFNLVNKHITDSLGISYVDITPISRSDFPDLVASDGLHPSGKQYKLWVDQLYTIAKQKIEKY
jgi:acyl-CoA thioesterase I